MDKLNLAFDETRDMIEQEGWLAPKWATIQELAFVYGLLDNASEFFSWARVHLLNLCSLLADCIRRTYGIAKRSIQVQERVSAAEKVLPRQLHDRLSSMQCRIHAEFVWRNNWKVSVNTAVRRGIQIIYDYLKSGRPWEQPIGHVVKRSCLCVVHGLVRGGGWCLHSHIENHQHYSLVGRTVEACNFATETLGQAAYQLCGIYWHYCGGGNPLRVVSRERESIPSAPHGCHFL
ncbi:hypothetical protein IV203_019200 [Nitzschia inconspicua]|uniref:Uncharacterized protein n=1 Tax=Nitzschia inconspicua TaxID=303405 RepID=A0A9K3Q510_9STRA|nr:hypothetical protein IV203_019200 [Nitzschia inconspicua]